MRNITPIMLAAGAFIVLATPDSAVASGLINPDGYGIYSPAEPPTRHRRRVYRYDPRSWYYKTRGYYPFYGSSYWVPRQEMRYRYRYVYHGPRYRYFPAWGFPVE